MRASVGVISGPSVRLTDERLQALVPAAQQAADELAQASRVSAWFDRAYRPRVPSASMLAPAAAPAS